MVGKRGKTGLSDDEMNEGKKMFTFTDGEKLTGKKEKSNK